MSEIALAAGAKTFGPILGQLVANYLKRSQDSDAKKIEKIKTNIRPHLEATFKKCNTIKTLLNPLNPSDFLSIYTTQRFQCDRKTIDQYDLVDLIKNKHDHYIITGTGGSGKSMFMRYLWISLFETGDGRIPIFYELRNANSIANLDLVSLLYHTIIQGKSTLPKADFERRLKRGDFIIILDGFDEVSYEQREIVQKSIMQLAEHFPGLKVVVTSRPDDRFSSWTSFHVVSVSPLLKIDVLELVEKAEFDQEPKARFYKKIQTGDLYEKHRSFLSNPLLASMMLLTFSYDFDIPDKMSAFYDQAFDALYKRHDSHKPGGYKREFKTKLSEDSFKRLLSYFCLVSYYEMKFEFDTNTVCDFARKAIKIDRCECEPEDFIHDLHECVCILIKDGLTYTFSHRSFQEYFAAYCMCFVTSKNFDKLIQKFAARPNDQVVPLIADMNPEAFLGGYAIPMAEKYWGILQRTISLKTVALFMEALNGTFRMRAIDPSAPIEEVKDQIIIFDDRGDLSNFCTVARRLSPPRPRSEKQEEKNQRDFEFVKKMLGATKDGSVHAGYLKVSARDGAFLYSTPSSSIPRSRGERLNPSGPLDAEFTGTGMYEYIAERFRATKKYATECRSHGEHLDDAMRDVFDFDDD